MDVSSQMPLLLEGCCREALRADRVSLALDGMRTALPTKYHAHMYAVSDELWATARLLRELAARSQAHAARAVAVVVPRLDIVLPCLARSMRDMAAIYEDRSISRENRWCKIYNSMTDEAEGLLLHHRFILFNHFLSMLPQLLTRSHKYNSVELEAVQARILDIRELIGILPPPTQPAPRTRPETLCFPVVQDRDTQWAEKIFTQHPTSHTLLKNLRSSSASGPHLPWGPLNIHPDSKIVLRRSFDNDSLSVTVVLHGPNRAPYILLRTYHRGAPLFSLLGVHELCIERRESGLLLTRWSNSRHCAKLWASLYFDTWEALVLFHQTFVALKLRSPMTLSLAAAELRLNERRLFQAQIIDDGFKHVLIVLEDPLTKSIRLHATILGGALQGGPVWTAFVTNHQSASPAWIVRKSRHRVWLHNLRLHVFCNQYNLEHQRQGESGAFEVYFVSGEASSRFRDVFVPPEPADLSESDLKAV